MHRFEQGNTLSKGRPRGALSPKAAPANMSACANSIAVAKMSKVFAALCLSVGVG
jgi:hypothetical protein